MFETAPKVKICGITNLADAELAVELGAWAIGMIFYDGSPRRCSLDEAQRITAALHRKVELCGVFVNDPLELVVKTSEDLGLTIVQLHGDEGPAFCGEVPRRTGARVIKAAQVAGPGDVRDLERYHVDFHLLDARSQTPEKQELRGGTGETFDWALLAERRSQVPLILSGGLSAENVAEAVARTRPFAVDSASGTEQAPGKKDEAKLRAFFAAVQSSISAEESAEEGSLDGAPEGPDDVSISFAEPNNAEDGTEALTLADSPTEGETVTAADSPTEGAAA